ncbi:MAG: transposase [Bacilli bacterium]|nr:transposase [Bacilli bacterium]
MKIVKRTYRYRIYPNYSQMQLIEKTLGCCRQVYNDFLSMCIESFEKDNSFKIKKYDLVKLLPEYKEVFPYIKEVDSIAIQQTVIHLYDAYVNFFKHKANFPKFKKKKNDYGYTTMNINNSIRIIGNDIQIPKLGKVRLIYHRHIPDSFNYSTVSISRSGKYYYVSLIGEEEYFDYQEYLKEALDPYNSIGLDFSLSHLFVASSGKHVDMPKYYEASLTKLAKEQRKLSHMEKDSSHYKKQLIRVKTLHTHIANQRKDYLHKLSRELANKYDYVFVEDLDLKEMSKRKEELRLGITIFDLGYSTFLNYLAYKLDWLNKKLVKINRYYPSSQLCSTCGYQNPITKNLGVKKWECPTCHSKHDRDLNAAINIKKEGIRMILAQTH